MRTINEQSTILTTMSGTCVYNHYNTNYLGLKDKLNEIGGWKIVGNQLFLRNSKKNISVFFPNGVYSVRKGLGNINEKIDLQEGKWRCDGNDEFYVLFDYGNNGYSTKRNEFFDKDTLDDLSTTSSSAENSSNNSSNTSTKITPVLPENPEEVKDIVTNLKYPNDKNYRYGKKDDNWYARNVNSGKIFNISKYKQFNDSVKRLNDQFPNVGDTLNTTNNKEGSNLVVGTTTTTQGI